MSTYSPVCPGFRLVTWLSTLSSKQIRCYSCSVNSATLKRWSEYSTSGVRYRRLLDDGFANAWVWRTMTLPNMIRIEQIATNVRDRKCEIWILLFRQRLVAALIDNPLYCTWAILCVLCVAMCCALICVAGHNSLRAEWSIGLCCKWHVGLLWASFVPISALL